MLKNFEAENIIENLYNSNKVLGVIITHALNIEYFDKAYEKLWHQKVIPTNIRPALSSGTAGGRHSLCSDSGVC